MYIGCLNDRIENLSAKVTRKNGRLVPNIAKSGNPFAGEELRVSWQELYETGIDLHVSCPGNHYVDTLVLTFGANSAPTRVAAYSADKSELYYEYRAETGKTITEKSVSLVIGERLESFVIELDVSFTDAALTDIQVYGAITEEINILPTPMSVKTTGGEIPLGFLRSFESDCPEGVSAAAKLSEKLEEAGGHVLEQKAGGFVRMTKNASLGESEYILTVNKDGVAIEASDLRGFVYAGEVIIKLIKNGNIPCCRIEDKPASQFRGVHLFLPAPDQMDFARRLIKYIISPMGYNTIIMEIAGAMEFKSHPEINEKLQEALEKQRQGIYPKFPHGDVGGEQTVPQEQVAAFADYVRSFGIDFIPEVQCFGHVQYITYAHPEIAERSADAKKHTEETDERLADVPPLEFYDHCYCPSNEKSYEILFDLADEIIAVTKPQKYINMGHDEVFTIGVCPLCKDKDPAELYAYHVNRVHDYVTKHGLKMMIWADMVQAASGYKTVPAAKLIPKDILMGDFIWYFHTDKDIEDNLLAEGFNVVTSNLYSSHYPRYNSRRAKKGMLGGHTAGFVETREDFLAREGKLYDFIFTGEMLWDKAYDEHCRLCYDGQIVKTLPRLRENLGNRRYPSLKDNAKETVLCENAVSLPPVSGLRTEFECRVNGAYESLIFEHTCSEMLSRIPWVPLYEIGCYEVTYEDGETEKIKLEYTGNINYWARRRSKPFPSIFYRHNGYTASAYFTDGLETRMPSGQIACIYRYEWINPKPEKKVASVKLVQSYGFDTAVLVSRVVGVN